MNNLRYALVMAAFLLGSCSDPIGLDRKRIAGDYWLVKFSEGTPVYYISDQREFSGGGTFDGAIKQLGYNSDFILANVQRLSSSDISGFYILHLKTARLEGPLSESDPRISTVPLVTAEIEFTK